MADRSVRVTLSAQVQGYIDGMQKASQATREVGSEAEKLQAQREAFEMMGRAAMVAGGAIAAGLALSTKAAIDWDSAWAGVTKTVDGTPEQMAALEQGLRDLTGVLPASHAEIAAVAEAAGQLGIQTPNVVEFTRTMIDLGETTNLSADQAATSLARFMNVMGTSQDRVSELGSALVELGNNYATTEAEIVEMSMRLAGAGRQIGLSEGEVLGLSTALSSVGIEAEAGGSAMSKVMIDIAASVDKGGERLEMFSKVAGVSADTFANKWRSDPGAALALFVRGLSNAEAQGTSTLGVLEELGITEVRMRDALLRSASASDLFTEAMNQGNSAMKENTALSAEAEKRYETTAAQLQIMGNKVTDAAIAIGEHLLPLVEGAAGSVGGFADAISSMDGPMSGFVTWGALIVGTGLLGVGLWAAAIPQIAKYKVAMETLNLAGGKLEGTLKAVGKGVGFAAAVGVIIALARDAEIEVTAVANSIERATDATESLGSAASAFSKAGWSDIYGGLGDVKVGLDDVAAALDNVKHRSEGGLFATNMINQGELEGTKGALKLLGDEMAKLADTNLPKMQAGLRDLSDEYSLTDEQQWSFIENSPNLRKALEESAAGLGLTTNKADLLKIAFGDVTPATEEATDAAEENADALAELEGKAAATSDQISELADIIRGLGSAQLDLREANRNLEESFDSFTESVVTNGFTLDTTTEKGRAVESAIDDMATATLEAAAATLEQTGSQEAANQVLAAGRERIIDMIAPYFESRDAAAAYIDTLGLTPQNLDTAVSISGVAEAEAQLAWVARRREALIDIRTNGGDGSGALNFTPFSANGNMFEYANGGGLDTGIYSGGPPITRFAEPETRWEAFISGKPGQEDRNRQIWVETGRRLGMGDMGGSSAPTQVSLAGARFTFEVEGRPFTGIIREQIAGASVVAGSRVRQGSDRRF